MRRTAFAILTLALAAAGAAQERRLDDGRQWLEAGTSVSAETDPLRRAAIATSVNDVASAEPALAGIIRARAGSDAASHAHELLSRIYLRAGQYKKVIDNLDAWAKALPDRPELKSEKADVDLFRGLPDQVNGPRTASTLRHESGDFAVPVTINGKAATYLLDTGAWISAITEPEAARLGLSIRNGSGSIGDASGKGVKVRTAVAKELVIGDTRFRDVSFVVLPNQEPWTSMPVGRGGIIGVPVILALGRVEWSRDTWRLGGRSDTADRAPRNVVFSGNHLIVDMRVSGRQVFGALDTGAETTDLNSNFADAFAELIRQSGVRGARDITGLGGTETIDAVTLPEVVFEIGVARHTLRPAHVTLQRTAAVGGNCCIGNLGLDLLTQNGFLAMDFGAMTLRIR